MLPPLMSESMEYEADDHEVTCAARRAVVELLAQRLKVTGRRRGEPVKELSINLFLTWPRFPCLKALF